jgi:hypothetical protein
LLPLSDNLEKILSRKDIIQINATIIVGILTFLAIYSNVIFNKEIYNRQINFYIVSMSIGFVTTSFVFLLLSIGIALDIQKNIKTSIYYLIIGLVALLDAIITLISVFFDLVTLFIVIGIITGILIFIATYLSKRI